MYDSKLTPLPILVYSAPPQDFQMSPEAKSWYRFHRANEADDAVKRMPTHRNIATAEDCSAAFFGTNISLKTFELMRFMWPSPDTCQHNFFKARDELIRVNVENK